MNKKYEFSIFFQAGAESVMYFVYVCSIHNTVFNYLFNIELFRNLEFSFKLIKDILPR